MPTTSPYVIAISGYTGAGKSTVINHLLTLFGDAVALLLDDHGTDAIFPSTVEWVANGANPDEFITPQFTENIRLLKEEKPAINPRDKSEIPPTKYILIEEPFGKSRTVMKPLIDFHVQMDIPPEIALARRILRNIERLEKNPSSESVKEFLDWYLNAGQQFFILTYELAAKEKDLSVDGLRSPEETAQIIFEAVQAKRNNQNIIPSMKTITHPSPNEYAEFYAGYIEFASARDNVLTALSKQIDEIKEALGVLTDKQALFHDAPNEWSIKEVMGHINDVERVFSYRLLRVSRNDQTPLPGFEQDDYVREAGYDNYLLVDLINEFELLRNANIIAINNMSDTYAGRLGTASGFPISVRALIYMMVGHVDHHMASLQEKYLPAAVTL